MKRAKGGAIQEMSFASARALEAPLVVAFSERERASLRCEVFLGGDLDRVDFSKADLRDARFEDTSLTGTSFEDADLRGARFIRCNLSGANFDGALLAGTDFRDSRIDAGIALTMAAACARRR